MLRKALAERHPRLDPKRLHTLAFVVETTIEALTHRAVVEIPSWLKSGVIEDEAFNLLSVYLESASAKSHLVVKGLH